MAFPPSTLNFILIPLMAPGHIIPMIDMAKLLAKRGVSVSIVVTPVNAARFNSVISRAVASGLPIRLLQIRFPAEEAGLPPGCESADCLPSYHLIRNFFLAISMLQKPFEEMLVGLSPGPSCIICDKHLSWTADTCDKFRIPRIIFDGMGCFAQLIMQRLYATKAYETTADPSEPFLIPDLPDRIEFTRKQLPGYFNPGPTYIGDFREQVVKTESRAYGVVSNSFEELENGYLDEYKKLKSGKVWCIGPLSLCNDDDSLDTAQRGNQAGIDTEKCLGWLDGREPGSAVYACHGSLSRLSPGQFAELASGLELSGRPFILVVKGGDRSGEIERWVSDSGFEERVKGRGLLIRGWAPQVMILSHSAIGGFLTHCGWNSTLEGVCAGVPMITWPIFAERDTEAVQQFFANMEAAFKAHSLWARSSEEELESAGEGLEKYVMTKLFTRMFASTPEDVKVDEQLHEKIALIHQFIRPENLDIKPTFQNETSYLLAQRELLKINTYKAPRDKLVCILNYCKVISNQLLDASRASNEDHPGADEFLPVLIYVTIKANPPQLHSNLAYIERFRRKTHSVAEAAYFFTNMLSVESFIMNIDAKSLSMDEHEFEKNMESARTLLSSLSESSGTQSQSDQNNEKYVNDRSSINKTPSISDLENKGARMLLEENEVSQVFQDFPFLYSEAGDLTVSDVEDLLSAYKQLVFKYVCLAKGLGVKTPPPSLTGVQIENPEISRYDHPSADVGNDISRVVKG